MIASTHNLTQDTRVVADTVELQYTRDTTPAVAKSEHYTHTPGHPRAQPLRGSAKHTVPPL